MLVGVMLVGVLFLIFVFIVVLDVVLLLSRQDLESEVVRSSGSPSVCSVLQCKSFAPPLALPRSVAFAPPLVLPQALIHLSIGISGLVVTIGTSVAVMGLDR